MTEVLFDVYSKRDRQGQMYLRDARLMVGGEFVDFTEGVAVATAAQARLLATRDDLTIMPRSAAVTAEDLVEVEVEPVPPEVELEPESESAEEVVEAVAPVDDEALRLAREHLEADGETVPEPDVEPAVAVPVPDGFEATTADGSARCLAAKADGSQCQNAAADGHACAIAKHREQVAERS